jgi:hypothetical protein
LENINVPCEKSSSDAEDSAIEFSPPAKTITKKIEEEAKVFSQVK